MSTKETGPGLCVSCGFGKCEKMANNFRYYYCCSCVPSYFIKKPLRYWVCNEFLLRLFKERTKK